MKKRTLQFALSAFSRDAEATIKRRMDEYFDEVTVEEHRRLLDLCKEARQYQYYSDVEGMTVKAMEKACDEIEECITKSWDIVFPYYWAEVERERNER